jgi:hypothetical protein
MSEIQCADIHSCPTLEHAVGRSRSYLLTFSVWKTQSKLHTNHGRRAAQRGVVESLLDEDIDEMGF